METEPVAVTEHQKEDDLTREVEQYTATAPSNYLGVIIGAVAVSLIFPMIGRGKWRNFFAQWIPAGLILYLYGKALKREGHGRTTPLRNEQRRAL
jgi:hypothetical protein